MPLYAHDPAKQKKIKVGEVIGTAVIIEKKQQKHFMRVVDGYGIQKGSNHASRRKQGSKSQNPQKQTWDSTGNQTLSDWRLFGRLADYGNGKQWFLSMKYMKQYKPSMETIK